MAQVGMDYYEDMFKEITKKFYGEDDLESTETFRMMQNFDGIEEGHGTLTAFSLAALMQSSLPSTSLIANPGLLEASVEAEENKWIQSDEILPWTTSKIASYNTVQKLFRCNECESISFLSRIAEHWLGTHANLRVFQCLQCPYASAWARCVRMHLARQHNVCIEQNTDSSQVLWKENPVLDEVTKYLQRLKQKVEGERPLVHSTTVETQQSVKSDVQIPALKLQNSLESQEPIHGAQLVQGAQLSQAVHSAQLIKQEPLQTMQIPLKQEVNQIITAPSKLHVNHETVVGTTSQKRYNCTFCPYATDRRDLYTRHENIHKEEKPFQCYVCTKQFNRADHVKKHFLRMHRDHPYDINRIRREVSKSGSSQTQYLPKAEGAEVSLQIPISQLSQLHTVSDIQHVLNNGLAIPSSISLDKTKLQVHQVQRPKRPGEKRYSCCYCSWSGVDNWCLKRHLNTHTKPFSCGLCEYKAARAERLATHVHKVHNKRACGRCSFLADDQPQLLIHQQQQHHNSCDKTQLSNAFSLNLSILKESGQDFSLCSQKVLSRHGLPDLIPIGQNAKLPMSNEIYDSWSSIEKISRNGYANEVTLKCNNCSFSTATLTEIASHNCQFKNRFSQNGSTAPQTVSKVDFLPVETILEEISDSNQSLSTKIHTNVTNFTQENKKVVMKSRFVDTNQNEDKNNNQVCQTLARQLEKKLRLEPSQIVRISWKLCQKLMQLQLWSWKQKVQVKINGKKMCVNFKTGSFRFGKLHCQQCLRNKTHCQKYQNSARLVLHGLVAHNQYLRIV